MKNDPKELVSVVAWMISMNRCLISLIAHNGEYFDLCRKVSQKKETMLLVSGSSKPVTGSYWSQ